MKKITLTQGQFAIVDDADFDFLAAYKWQAHRRSEKYTYYAMRTVYNPKRTIYMHKAIAEKYGIKGQLLGHVDKNGLNNQKDNLIFATASNVRQYRRKLGKSSLPIGVRQRKNGKYDSRIQVGNKSVYLGLYASMDEAAEKYKLASRFYFGDFAPTQ